MPSSLWLQVNIAQQQLKVLAGNDGIIAVFSIASAKRGIGQQLGSEQTPLGWHEIGQKVGAAYPQNAVFIERNFTGEIYAAALAHQYPERDWILTRILRLRGCESGLNQGGQVDTWQREIYIHGTPDTNPMGVPNSHGCIRMRNRDIMQLFEQVSLGTAVQIVAE